MPFVLSAPLTLLPFHGHSHPRAWPDLHCRPVYKAFCEVQGVWEASLGQSPRMSLMRPGAVWSFAGLGKLRKSSWINAKNRQDPLKSTRVEELLGPHWLCQRTPEP